MKSGRAGQAEFMSGIGALVELPMIQRRRDAAAGLNTAGLVSGYRGSPLGAYDQQLWRAKRALEAHDIRFEPGLNEDLAATALWGAQMHKAFGPARVEGVFGIWYGKGPGVDRSGDAFRNANMLGTSPLGGVLAIGGDDHAAQSSMFPHQTDGIFQSVMMPVLQPANVSDVLEMGLAGIALSRFSGLWVAMKTIAEVVEASAVIEIPGDTHTFLDPAIRRPAHGLNWDPRIAWPGERAELERRLVEERLPAAIAWIRANGLDRAVLVPPVPRLTVATVGKAHTDLMQALEDLGIGEAEAAVLGLGVFKFGVSWPVDTDTLVHTFGRSEEFLVVEEKQPTVENQIKSAFYGRSGPSPRIVGKTNETGQPLLRPTLEFSPLDVAEALMTRLQVLKDVSEEGQQILGQAMVQLKQMRGRSALGNLIALPPRKPFFCSGCPHNSSTRTPDGSISGGGIGCHVMALSQPSLKTETFSQMGGEGLQWVGAQAFSQTPHIFQNMGDGTYQHSGVLAIRAAIAANTNITFKILYNDAVAMTGGQPAEGTLDPSKVVAQLAAEGIATIALVSDQPEKWRRTRSLPPGTRIEHRDGLDALQKEMRDLQGVSAIVYEQTCAAEKRRRRKKEQFPDPPTRLFINPRVCEGCGDCSVQSNCISVEPIETDYGRKRRINQSSCNKDFSCVKGFCPSFVEVADGILPQPDQTKIRNLEDIVFQELPAPELPRLDGVTNIYITGIGGLGVLTLGSILGAAANFDGNRSTVLDFTGLAQKNGAVVSHVRIAGRATEIHSVRLSDGSADVLLAADSLVAAASSNIIKLDRTRTAAVVNTDEAPTSDNVQDRDFSVPTELALKQISQHTHASKHYRLPVSSIALALFGDTIGGNIFILGYAWQKGLLPVSGEAIHAAISANGKAVTSNLRAFEWGRVAAHDMDRVSAACDIKHPQAHGPGDAVALARELALYQDAGYARRYEDLVERARRAAGGLGEAGADFVSAVAENAFKLMAYKDEYEVASLYAAPEFLSALRRDFSSWRKLSVWLAPPGLSVFKEGVPQKRKFGAWVFPVFAILARLKFVRGKWYDPFGHTEERREERQLVRDYFALVEELSETLTADTIGPALRLARLPGDLRGYGHVKAQSLEQVRRDWQSGLGIFRARRDGVQTPRPVLPMLVE